MNIIEFLEIPLNKSKTFTVFLTNSLLRKFPDLTYFILCDDKITRNLQRKQQSSDQILEWLDSDAANQTTDNFFSELLWRIWLVNW